MNTIPLIFNERQINRTVIGGRTPSEKKMDVSAVLLNSNASRFHAQTLESLSKCGFASVVSIEPNSGNYNIEALSRRIPTVQFVVPLEAVTDGDMINIGIGEAPSSYVLVLRDSLYIPQGILPPHLAENLVKTGTYCIAPRLSDAEKKALPVNFTPEASRGRFSVSSSAVVKDGMHTLYPFDYIGLYNKTKFIQLGGFDYTITSPYYQNLDLALRSWLWGEETCLSTSMLFSYSARVPIEDTTADLTYLQFYLKNLAPRFKSDSGGSVAPLAFFNFLAHSSCGFFEAKRRFSDAKKWVHTNRARFHMDVKHLIETWGA